MLARSAQRGDARHAKSSPAVAAAAARRRGTQAGLPAQLALPHGRATVHAGNATSPVKPTSPADGNFPATDGAASAHHFTAPRHHQVPDAGYNLPQEAPDAFAEAVLEPATFWLPIAAAGTLFKEIPVTHPAASPPPRDALASTLKRTEIQHSPTSIPGREIVQVLTEIPVGVDTGAPVAAAGSPDGLSPDGRERPAVRGRQRTGPVASWPHLR